MDKKMYVSSDEINLKQYENDLNSGSIIRVFKPESDIGIDLLAKQYVNNQLKDRDYCFNIMLLGQTGIGKSTLIDSMFKRKFNDESTKSHSQSKVEIIANYYDLEEKEIHLRLGVIESKGFGDQLIKDHSYKPIVEYIEQQFENYLAEELRIERKAYWTDTRVHVCLYLISPIGHGLKAIDLVTMKKLGTKVNLIPIIAKSDLITKPELRELKQKIMSEIETNGINIYRFPTDEPEVSEINAKNNLNLPFAVIASNEFILIGDKEVRARQYPWGTVEVENESHSDFKSLREMIVRTNLHDLNQSTHNQHYEQYRSHRLEKLWKDKQSEHLTELKTKERQLFDNFTAKLRAKELELKTAERELHQRFESMSKERIEEKMKLDLDRQRLDDDIRALNVRKQLMFNQKTSAQESGDRKQSHTSKNRTK